MGKNDLAFRAMAAYYRSANRQMNDSGRGGSVIQPSKPQEVEIDGLRYYVLSNVNGILAVYRVRIVNDEPMLKGLKRWPKEIDAAFGR